jgi:hypothetical protein
VYGCKVLANPNGALQVLLTVAALTQTFMRIKAATP